MTQLQSSDDGTLRKLDILKNARDIINKKLNPEPAVEEKETTNVSEEK